VTLRPAPSDGPHPGGPPATDVLAAPVWHALTGHHAPFALRAVAAGGRVTAVRYEPDVSPFAAVADPADPGAWDALRSLVAPGEQVVILDVGGPVVDPWPPAGWDQGFAVPGVQMVAGALVPAPDPEAVPLGAADVQEMLDLVAQTRPGPFERRTVELGGYLGVRDGGRLVAMAGRRFAPGGYREISAVCTAEDHRGRGLGGRLLGAVAAGIVADGEIPFLHTGATNTGAIRLYEALGLRRRRSVRFVGLRPATV
jgi:ribosomal protein S18 acetylase RimI-like enzyme